MSLRTIPLYIKVTRHLFSICSQQSAYSHSRLAGRHVMMRMMMRSEGSLRPVMTSSSSNEHKRQRDLSKLATIYQIREDSPHLTILQQIDEISKILEREKVNVLDHSFLLYSMAPLKSTKTMSSEKSVIALIQSITSCLEYMEQMKIVISLSNMTKMLDLIPFVTTYNAAYQSFYNQIFSQIKHSRDSISEYFLARLLSGVYKLNDSRYKSLVENCIQIIVDKVRNSSTQLVFVNENTLAYCTLGMAQKYENTESWNSLLELLADILNRSNIVMSSKSISESFFALKRMSSSIPSAVKYLTALANKAAKNHIRLCNVEISSAVFGLQNFSSSEPATIKAVAVLTQKLASCRDNLDGQCIANCLYGLKEMTNQYEEVRAFLRALSLKIEICKPQFNNVSVGLAFYGFKNMTAMHPQVREVLTVLLDCVRSSNFVFNSRCASMAFYGLQKMSTNESIICDIVAEFTRRIKDLTIEDSQTISNILYGLRKMENKRSPELLELLQYLAQQIRSTNISFSEQAVCNSLSGLFNMSESPEVSNLLQEIVKRLNKTKVSSTKFIAMSVYGLHNMPSTNSAALDILEYVSKTISTHEEQLSSDPIAYSIFGLRSMDADKPEVRNYLKVMANQLRRIPEKMSAKHAAMVLHGLANMKSEAAELDDLMEALYSQHNPESQFDAPEQMCSALAGLHLKDSSKPIVKKLYSMVVDMMRKVNVAFSEDVFVEAMVSLQNTSSEDETGMNILFELAKNLKYSDTQLSEDSLAKCVYSMKNMSDSDNSVRFMLAALTLRYIRTNTNIRKPDLIAHIKLVKPKIIKPIQLELICEGLQHMSGSKEVYVLLHLVDLFVKNTPEIQLNTLTKCLDKMKNLSLKKKEVVNIALSLVDRLELIDCDEAESALRSVLMTMRDAGEDNVVIQHFLKKRLSKMN